MGEHLNRSTPIAVAALVFFLLLLSHSAIKRPAADDGVPVLHGRVFAAFVTLLAFVCVDRGDPTRILSAGNPGAEAFRRVEPVLMPALYGSLLLCALQFVPYFAFHSARKFQMTDVLLSVAVFQICIGGIFSSPNGIGDAPADFTMSISIALLYLSVVGIVITIFSWTRSEASPVAVAP